MSSSSKAEANDSKNGSLNFVSFFALNFIFYFKIAASVLVASGDGNINEDDESWTFVSEIGDIKIDLRLQLILVKFEVCKSAGNSRWNKREISLSVELFFEFRIILFHKERKRVCTMDRSGSWLGKSIQKCYLRLSSKKNVEDLE